jgi:pilus assembly protein CpaD
MSSQIMRFAALAAVLLAGSCAAPSNDDVRFADPVADHPITVQPEYQSVKVSFPDGAAGLMPEDSAQLDGLVRDYLESGSGAISVSVPDGPDSSRVISYFGERLVDMGVSRSHILVAARPLADGDRRIEISFVSYVAHTEPCGDWSENVADTASNLPMPNFGCAVQHNIAAMVANPRDLDGPRGMGGADAARRATVTGKYEKGETTATARTGDQVVSVSGVAQQ